MDEVAGQGKGLFLWYRSITSGGSLDLLVQQARAMNLSHVAIKIADGLDLYPNVAAKWSDAEIDPMIDAFHAMGIQVWVWQYVYNYRPEDEARYVAKRIRARKNKITGLIVDAEWECKLNRGNAQSYMRTLRTELGDLPIGISSYRFPSYHPQLNWPVFAHYADMWWPQVYWEQAHNPAAQLKRSVEECLAIKCMPVVPIGSAYQWGGWAPTVEDLNQFDQAVKTAGLRGLSWWVWNQLETHPAWYRAILGHVWKGPFGNTPPVERLPLYQVLPLIGLKVRSGPSVNYPRIGGLPHKAVISVEYIQKYESSAWARIDFSGKPGWVCMWQGTPSSPYLKPVDVMV